MISYDQFNAKYLCNKMQKTDVFFLYIYIYIINPQTFQKLHANCTKKSLYISKSPRNRVILSNHTGGHEAVKIVQEEKNSIPDNKSL